MSEFWSRYVQQVVSRGRLGKVAIYGLNGTKLVSTPNCDLWGGQVRGIVAALNSPNIAMFKLALGDMEFNCLKARTDTLVGRELANKELFVAHQIGDTVVVGLGVVDGAGSCIYELQQLYLDVKQSDLIDLDEEQGDEQMTGAGQRSNALEVNHSLSINNNRGTSLENMRKLIR